MTVLSDGGKLRIYYRGHNVLHPEVVCYAESSDGINWCRPDRRRPGAGRVRRF